MESWIERRLLHQARAGRALHPSGQVLAALSEALRLNDLDRSYLRALMAGPAVYAARPAVQRECRDDLVAMSAAFSGASMVHLLDAQLNLTAIDSRTRALMFPGDSGAPNHVNLVSYVFEDHRSRDLYVNWADKAAEVVGLAQLTLATEPDCDDLRTTIKRAWELNPVRWTRVVC